MPCRKVVFCSFQVALLILLAQSLRASPIGAVIQGFRYDAARQIVTFDLLNASHKEISAYSLSVRVTHPDGSVGTWEYGGDFLPFMSTNGGAGALAPGAIVQVAVPVGNEVQAASATVNVVVYTDGTADGFDPKVLGIIAAKRKGAIRGLEKANELLQEALANPNDAHPSLTVVSKLKALAKQYEVHAPTGAEFDAAGLLGAATNISNAPRSPAGRSENEDEYLRSLIKRHQDRISLMQPHTQLTKAVQP
jgi:hypothetical protein